MNLLYFVVLILLVFNIVLPIIIWFFIIKMLRQLGTIISRNMTLFQEYDAMRLRLK